MEADYAQSQPTLGGELEVAHIQVEIPVKDGDLPIGWSIRCVDMDGGLTHLESWSRGSFRSPLHALFTLALSLQRIIAETEVRSDVP